MFKIKLNSYTDRLIFTVHFYNKKESRDNVIYIKATYICSKSTI